MKKYLSLALALVMMLALAVPAIAGSAATDADTATLEGVGFHCNHGGSGNGKTDVYYSETGPKARTEIFDAKGKVLKGVAADTGTKFKFDFERVDETTWKLVSENYYCVECGNNIWASYSNKSGVPNGKNIQVNPYTPPVEEDPTPYSSLSILKTVGGTPLAAWAEDNGYDLNEIMAGMSFTAYLLDSEDGERAVPEVSFPGELQLTGDILFGNELPIGWYEVVEEISGTAVNYFVGEGKSEIYYVGQTGVSSEIVNFVSGGYNGESQIGTVVSREKTDEVNWTLPDVWNGQLAGMPAFQKLMEMGAKWIWDTEDTYIYGVSGSTYSETFTVSLTEATEATIYFAADNVALIYVNGKLAAYTNVALKDRGVRIGDDYDNLILDNLTHDEFDGRWGEGWAYAYEAKISLDKGDNEIIIIAANSSSAGYIDENDTFVNGITGTDNDSYNYSNNPCGLIFGFEIPAVTFDNEPKDLEVYGDVTVTAEVELYNEVDNYTPVYDYVGEQDGTIVSNFKNAFSDDREFGVFAGPQGWFEAKDGDKLYLATGNNHDIIDSGLFYEVAIDDSYVTLTFTGVKDMNVGLSVFGDRDSIERITGHGQQQMKQDITEDNNSMTFEKPSGDNVYIVLHIDGANYYYSEPKFDHWELCCKDTVACDTCVAPVLTAKIYDADGKLVDEANLEGLSNEASFEGLPYGDYTVELYNGETLLGTQEITIDENADSGSVDFGTISLRCECAPIVNENENHDCEN